MNALSDEKGPPPPRGGPFLREDEPAYGVQPVVLVVGMLANILTGIVAAIHLYIVVLEMVLWDTPPGRKAFGMTEEFSRASKVLAANQGLYNGFLAAGLIWGIWLGEAGDPVKVFFLLCVAVAGVFGAATVSTRILLIQTVPAVIALAAVVFA